MKTKFLSLMLCFLMVFITVPMSGCSSTTFLTDLNLITPAVLNVLQIVALFEGVAVNSSLEAKVTGDVAAISKLYTDYQAAVGSDKQTIAADITAAFSVLNTDLATVYTVAQVKDPVTQAKIAALIGLIETAVQIAEAFITPPTATRSSAASLTASQLVDSYNKILTAKTGNSKVDAYTSKHELHIHGTVVRHLTFGVAK